MMPRRPPLIVALLLLVAPGVARAQPLFDNAESVEVLVDNADALYLGTLSEVVGARDVHATLTVLETIKSEHRDRLRVCVPGNLPPPPADDGRPVRRGLGRAGRGPLGRLHPAPRARRGPPGRERDAPGEQLRDRRPPRPGGPRRRAAGAMGPGRPRRARHRRSTLGDHGPPALQVGRQHRAGPGAAVTTPRPPSCPGPRTTSACKSASTSPGTRRSRP